ncbi:MAG TPA: ABC transporter permease [Anaerolineales bacterium]|nr:ABC transporter permease [Anaerolineales bacterium]
MRTLDLALKDLNQILRDWRSGLFLVVMPLLFTLFFGFVFGGLSQPKTQVDPRMPVGLVDRDLGTLAADLKTLMENSEVLRPVILGEEKAKQANILVKEGELAAVVFIPVGYTDQLFADQPLKLEVILDQSQPAAQTVSRALETVTGRLLGAVEAAHISASAIKQTDVQESVAQAIAAWQKPALVVSVEKGTGAAENEQLSSGGFAQASSGMMVQFSIFGLITSAMVLVLERKSGSLPRLLSSPIRRWEVIAGHILAMFCIIFAQQLILVLVGQFVFGVDYMRQPLAILVLITVLSLWAASLGLLISAVSRKEDQVITLSLVAMFVFAALGGAWFPLEVAGKAFAAVGHVMPTAWAMDGFQNILLRGLSFSSVLVPGGILLGYAVAFFGLAIWRFRFE